MCLAVKCFHLLPLPFWIHKVEKEESRKLEEKKWHMVDSHQPSPDPFLGWLMADWSAHKSAHMPTAAPLTGFTCELLLVNH